MLVKLFMFLLSGLIVLPISAAPWQSTKLDLPLQARDALYLKFPDWRFVEVPDEVRQVLKRDHGPNARPDLISGDFDGDGRVDYAAFVSHGTVGAKQGELTYPKECLAVFMARDQKYQMQLIEDVNADYVQLIHKGDGGYDYETQRDFTYLHDAIDAVIFEKAATTYVYENGGFRAIITGD